MKYYQGGQDPCEPCLKKFINSLLEMDGFSVTKSASGPKSSYLIEGFPTAIIKSGIKERNKKVRNKVLLLHAHTRTHKLIPKAHTKLKSM